MDIHKSNYGYPQIELWISINIFMDIHNWFIDIHNSIMDIRDWIVDIHN